jgi:hypothetical protein
MVAYGYGNAFALRALIANLCNSSSEVLGARVLVK